MKFDMAYTYDDLALVPIHSEIKSRKKPDTSTRVGKGKLQVPIISAPMNTVTEWEMCLAMSEISADAVLHRYLTIEEQVKQLKHIMCKAENKPFVAIGATGDYLERTDELYKVGVRKFCVDVANGHSETCLSAVRALKKTYHSKIDIMAGNVCTAEGAAALEASGANVIRVGIGPGSSCSTRLVTGFGVPQLSAINWCKDKIKNKRSTSIVADGGVRTSGDFVKALAAGADAVMIGGLLAGTSQSPGDTERGEHGLYKMFHGMASEEGRRNWFDKEATAFVPEGDSMRVHFQGDAKRIIEDLVGGLKVGMSFANAKTIKELQKNASWVRITDNGRREGNPNRKMFR